MKNYFLRSQPYSCIIKDRRRLASGFRNDSIKLLVFGLLFCSFSIAGADASKLILPGDLQVTGDLTIDGKATANSFSSAQLNGALTGIVRYEISNTFTAVSGEAPVNTNIRKEDGFCFLSGWDSDGNASSEGHVYYDSDTLTWWVSASRHTKVKATATCILWQFPAASQKEVPAIVSISKSKKSSKKHV